MIKFEFVQEFIPSSQNNTVATDGVTNSPIGRPLNAFMEYRRDMCKEPDLKQLNIHPTLLSRLIADMWKEEKHERKIKYEFKGELNAVNHKRTHPYYNHKKHSKAQEKRSRNKKQDPIIEENLPLSIPQNSSDVEQTVESSNEESVHEQTEPFSSSTPPSSVLDEIQIILDGTHLDYLTLSLYQSIDFVSISSINFP